MTDLTTRELEPPEPYYQSTGFVVDFDNEEEEVGFCISLDVGDVLIGRKVVENGAVVVDEWLATMNKETFEKLIKAYGESIKE